MKESQLPGYGLPTLAVFPEPWFEKGFGYLMYECKLKKDGSLGWYKRYLKEDEHFKADFYNTLDEAVKAAEESNESLSREVDTLSISSASKSSICLKVEKAVTVRKRRLLEEHLMLSEAIKRNIENNLVEPESVVVPDDDENLRSALIGVLKKTPYVQLVRLTRYGITLLKDDRKWVRAEHTKKTATYCYRERIARGFGYSGCTHWGKTKAAIRSMLLPRANKLLQLASVKRILDEAKSRGLKVVVLGGFVFWFESKSNVGWSVKELSESSSSDTNRTLWLEGTILSKNHGRIVVLPYIKEDGSHVLGHTKNSPHDGRALPRHKDEYVELPFEMLKDDLMFSLFGELKYE
ncbi:hypothetical protein LH51_04275 [Nitrincola sp. A-D6]|nr:hypothetical protein LH51_11450 [Nitrincola sp. A-D6]KGK42809.1 hypothetical protein LH51_04275 [Nitrincola sp. A-D6]